MRECYPGRRQTEGPLVSYVHAERLSATDTLFLEIEEASVHMHVGAVALFEVGPLRNPEGRLDIERLRTFTERALFDSPRCRQKLAWVPRLEHPVWVDDPHFNLEYHVRHTALPPPGDLRQLKRLAGRLMSQKLDRGKPLWEMWVVEGLEDGRVAVVLKAHHCMVDGIAGVDLLAALLRLEPDATLPPARRWHPRPAPSPNQLLRDEVAHRAALPFEMLRATPGTLRHPQRFLSSVRESAMALGETISAGLAPTTSTPFDTELSPYRRFDWTRLDGAAVREIRKQLGGTLNDVVLATVAGAVGRFLARRGQQFGPRDVFRVMVPVSVRKRGERGNPGNRVVNFLARLPVDERDPRRRLERTIETTRQLKESRLVQGAELIEELSDRTFDTIITEFVQLAARTHAYNMVVTNVPNSPRPVFLLGARLTEIYPLVPLFTGQGAGIALFSYDGHLCWGFNADWDAFPDLHDLVEDVEREFAKLREAAKG
jgi:WS/DGAT/MGAT family acyltransferase